jgi:primosomal protein N' (replication factor Y)
LTLHAEVAVPVPLGRAFSYAVPEALADRVRPGARVLCQFGARRVLGIVLSVGDGPLDFPESKLKPLAAVVDPEPVLPLELLSFLVELSSYYLSPIGEVMRLAVPAVERAQVRDRATLSLLEEAGAVAVGRLVQVAELATSAVRPEKLKGNAAAVFDALSGGPIQVSELAERIGNARAVLKRLASAGLVHVSQRPAETDPFFAVPAARDTPPALTEAQSRAVSRITERLDARGGGSFLLDGVTASGKTEVYLRAVARVLEKGGGAIVLVPEIALTPQLVNRFRARLGDVIAVLHSGLTDRERHAMWVKLRSGVLAVAVGARSALFAPVVDLALVCVDEEHDASFKQEEGVRYHARDMALLRAHRAGAVAVLGSATPSLKSYALVRSGKLERLQLPARAHAKAVLPRIEIVDLRRVGPAKPAGDPLLSLPLHRAIERTLAAREQAILFLNRRGFSPSIVCEECGHLFECPSCAVALTLHRARGERVVCHYCDYHAKVPVECPECHTKRLAHEGAGTERIESLLKAAFPGARIARLDRDVAAGLKSEAVLSKMRDREIDILVGTQMVTKGHDLPSVTLVGVLNADAGLGMPDFQAAERTFQLLVQVAGRAGRGDTPGLVMVQTRNPAHPAIAMAVTHDVAQFVDRELADRKELSYPPFSRIALVRIDAVEDRVARTEADRLAVIGRRAALRGTDIVGPAPAPIERLRGRYRYRFMVRAPERAGLRRALGAIAAAGAHRNARVVIDIDPVSML